MNTAHRKPLPGTSLDYFDARAAVDAIESGAYDKLSYTARVHAENLVRRCDPEILEASLRQLIERKRDLDFPWFPARVVCHDILGQTALVDLAGPAGCDRGTGRRSGEGQSRGAGAVDRRPFTRRRMRRFRS